MLRNLLQPSCKNLQVIIVRHVQKKFPKVDKKFQAEAESLAARGFLRPTKGWDPPANIEETIAKICTSHGLKPNSTFDALEKKYAVLKACFEETGYDVPNSRLHSIESVDDLQDFYSTPVDKATPFEALKRMDLPKNLHVQPDVVRFHPEKDTKFGGLSAFPKSSTIVSGLKTKKKYEGYEAKRSWP
ncbi:unnamed protein product [Arctia plantaginis]|uniref:Large ribosomal subunit protein mL50 n=1 Tax=Arctia plantaginis TaxID=874455 RepID=A0A8S0YQ45_ARCPL|nr:unnamed protein product [Arctia plantaginis]CAB3239269.1 unnamed protein product [Arctia plantaginis]